MSSPSWITANIVHSGSLDALLVNCVEPLIKDCMQRERVERFFWVRNQEGGAHIRLRFGGDAKILNGVVKTAIQSATQSYLERVPSFRPLSSSQHLHPNDSVFYSTYVPEKRRYGGPRCLEISERHFQDSSWSVMQILSQHDGHLETEERLKYSLALQLALTSAFLSDREEMIRFFQYVHRVRWHKMPELIYQELGIEHKLSPRRRHIDSFFENSTFDYHHFCRDKLAAIGASKSASLLIPSGWIEGVQQTAREVNDLQLINEIDIPLSWLKHSNPLWPLLESYCHMTHNRMGTRNLYEGFLAGIIAEALA